MILPIGHDRSEVHRWPLVSLALIAINLMATLLLNPGVAAHHEQSVEKLQAVIDYLVEHPWLHVDDRVPLSPAAFEQLEDVRTRIREAGVVNEVDTIFVQRRFDQLVDDWTALGEQAPLRRWGYVPAEPGIVTLFTTQFVHAGWLHLLSNLLILYLAGPPIEDRYGRPAFLALYLGAGVAATLTHAAFAGRSPVPLVGASGAIAGLMAVFLLCFASTRLRFAWVLAPFFKTFSLPAFVILPLWLANEIAAATIGRANAQTAGGVANFAHLGGFAFGLAVVGSLRFGGLERRLLRRVEARTGAEQRSDIEEIYDLLERGRERQAWQAAQRAHAHSPGDPELGLLLWRTARRVGHTARALGRASRLVRLQLAAGRHDEALVVLSEMAEAQPGLPLGRTERRALIEALDAAHEHSWSELLRAGLADEPDEPSAEPGSATAAAPAAPPPRRRRGDGSHRAPVHEVRSPAAGDPKPPPNRTETAPSSAPPRAAGSPRPASGAGEDSSKPDPSPIPAQWQVVAAEPTGLLDRGVALTVAGQWRVLPYQRILAVSLARIDDQRVLPYHVVDLVLGPAAADAAPAESERLQTVRVLAPPWDGEFLGGKDLREQCQLLVRGIREGAGCISLTAETVMPTFRSIAEHDTALASAWRSRGQKPRTYLAKPASRSSTVVP